MTLEEVKLRYVRYMVYECGGSRSEAARRLDISIRSVRNYINKMKELGLCEKDYVASIKDAEQIEELVYKFPTNKERVEHLDYTK